MEAEEDVELKVTVEVRGLRFEVSRECVKVRYRKSEVERHVMEAEDGEVKLRAGTLGKVRCRKM